MLLKAFVLLCAIWAISAQVSVNVAEDGKIKVEAINGNTPPPPTPSEIILDADRNLQLGNGVIVNLDQFPRTVDIATPTGFIKATRGDNKDALKAAKENPWQATVVVENVNGASSKAEANKPKPNSPKVVKKASRPQATKASTPTVTKPKSTETQKPKSTGTTAPKSIVGTKPKSTGTTAPKSIVGTKPKSTGTTKPKSTDAKKPKSNRPKVGGLKKPNRRKVNEIKSRSQALKEQTLREMEEDDDCFGPHTRILMADNSTKSVREIQVGDATATGLVTGCMKFLVGESQMFNYKGVLVTGGHSVFNAEVGVWENVQDSAEAEPVKAGQIKEVYDFDTATHHIIVVSGLERIFFSDFQRQGRLDDLNAGAPPKSIV